MSLIFFNVLAILRLVLIYLVSVHACVYSSTSPALLRDAVFIVSSVCKECDVTKPSIILLIHLAVCFFQNQCSIFRTHLVKQ